MDLRASAMNEETDTRNRLRNFAAKKKTTTTRQSEVEPDCAKSFYEVGN